MVVDHCECVKSVALEAGGLRVLRMVRAVALSRAIHWLETNGLSKRKTEKRKSSCSGRTHYEWFSRTPVQVLADHEVTL